MVKKQPEWLSLNFSIQDFDHDCYYTRMWPAQQKPAMFAPQLNLILLPQPTDTLNG